MARLLQRGQSMLTRRMQQAAAVNITYTRQGVAPIAIDEDSEVAAWLGVTRATSLADVEVRIDWADRDFLIPVAALVLIGEPRAGDRIALTLGGTAKTFELMQPAGAERVWSYSDTGETRYRVHAKRVV